MLVRLVTYMLVIVGDTENLGCENVACNVRPRIEELCCYRCPMTLDAVLTSNGFIIPLPSRQLLDH